MAGRATRRFVVSHPGETAMSLRKLLAIGCTVALVVGLGSALAPSAHAGSVSYIVTTPTSPYLGGGPFSFPTLDFPKFDLADLCLTGVCVTLDGHEFGFVGLENYEAFPKTLTSVFTAKLSLLRPDLSPLVAVQPVVPTSDPVTAFDGVVDYAGTSGLTITGLAAAAADSLCLSSPADLALFSGAGTIGLPCTALNLCTQSGANSWTFGIQTYAVGKVTYNYVDCATPAHPATWGSLKSRYR
jgi:hypothetical protein